MHGVRPMSKAHRCLRLRQAEIARHQRRGPLDIRDVSASVFRPSWNMSHSLRSWIVQLARPSAAAQWRDAWPLGERSLSVLTSKFEVSRHIGNMGKDFTRSCAIACHDAVMTPGRYPAPVIQCICRSNTKHCEQCIICMPIVLPVKSWCRSCCWR